MIIKKNIFKAIFILFCIISSGNLYSQDYWIRQQTPTSKKINKCFFINETTGWAAGDSGLVMKSTDSGVNWEIQNTNTLHEIFSVQFVNERIGWANALVFQPETGEFPGTLLMKTTDGGREWSNYMYPDTNNYFPALCYLDTLNGYIGGAPGFIVYTTDGGNSWLNAASDSSGFSSFPVNNITFLSRDTGYACGGSQDLAGLIWKSVDKGRSWTPSVIGPDPVNLLYFFDHDNSIGLSGDFKYGANIFKTNNNWLSSVNINLGYIGKAQSAGFRNNNEGWISIGSLSKLFRTTDGGNKWIIQDVPDSSAVFDIQFIDSAYGWCAGDHGAVYRYNTLMTGIPSENINEISSYHLSQNYPNPFNPVTVISYQIAANGNVLIKIYDISGKEVMTLVNEYKEAGRYDVTFSSTGRGNTLASGVYYYSISSGNFRAAKKMFLIK